MAEKQVIETATTETTTAAKETDTLAAAKGFWDKYSRPIIYVGGAIIVLLVGYLSYKEFVVAVSITCFSAMLLVHPFSG